MEAALAGTTLVLVGALAGAIREVRRLHAQLMQAWQMLSAEQKLRYELLRARDRERDRLHQLSERFEEVRELAAAFGMLGPLGPLLASLRDDMTALDKARMPSE